MPPPSPYALLVHDVHKSYRTRRVLNGVSFRLEPETLAGVVGPGYCPQEAVLSDAL
ncbi:hypothetical protein AB0B01_22490 [Streptomyces sp. NPDC044571]|uniref:hypothetical protein n=1 Tax=Streptomyces sp. NPDC044571 TaxID=3155371 RepID=UPI00340B5D0A